ncbi:MAG: hypothetical protein V2A70_07635, partial [Candidatus Omnitrophota bacterium]
VVLLREDGKKTTFDAESEIFNSINNSVQEERYLEVYFPTDLGVQDRIKIASNIEKEIYNILRDNLK